MSRVVIVGGYGAFGAHIAERLARDGGIEIVIAGRSLTKARAYADLLAKAGARAKIEATALDANRASDNDVRALGADVLINASGPFQAQNYRLARACIGAGCHYIDLADARAFVCGIPVLDDAARAAGVSVISGASSVPGVSSAAVAQLSDGLETVSEILIGISPGNSFDPGVATTASILGAVGKPFAVRAGGRATTAYGWQGLHRHRFEEIGARWMGDVDVPDLELLPAQYPGVETVRFTAGLEVGAFHLGLWGVSWLAWAGLLRRPGALAAPMLAMKRRLSRLGSDTGGMFVRVSGRDSAGVRQQRSWHLVAPHGHGPYVPGIASVILARRLLSGAGPAPGATPCVGLFELAAFESEVADLNIRCTVSMDEAGA